MFEINVDSYSIIGGESQTIHIMLKKNEKININKNYLISASSDELKENLYKNVDFIVIPGSKADKNKNIKKVDDSQIVNLKNTNGNVEYVSLSAGGKIMKIMPSFYNNLYIRLDRLLAFNNGIELYSDKIVDNEINKIFPRNNIVNINSLKLLKKIDYKFCLIKTKLNNEIEENNFNYLSNSFLFNKNNSINDMAFISGRNNLFEKRLGEGESMVLLSQSLVAFEGSISFRAIKNKGNHLKYVNDLNDIIIDGPGLIIFEYCQRIIPVINNKKYAIIAVTFFIFILQVIIHFIVFN